MTIIRKWSGDGLSSGPVTTSTAGPGDSVFSGIAGSPPVIDQSGWDRAPRILFPDAAGLSNVRWWPLPGAPLSSFAVRCYITASGIPTAYTVIRGNRSGSERWSIRVRSGSRLAVYSGGAQVWQGDSGSLPLDGSPVRIEVVVVGTQMTVTSYNSHTMDVLSSGIATVVADIDELWFGKALSFEQSLGFSIDDLAVSDQAEQIGPSGTPDPVDPPVTGIIRKWSGDGLPTGPIAAGNEDTPFSSTSGSPTVQFSGPRPPRIIIPDEAGIHNVRWWPLPGSPLTKMCVRAYVTASDIPSSCHLITANQSGAESWSVRAIPGGQVGLYANGARQWQSNGQVFPNGGAPLRIEVVMSGTNATVSVYNGHSPTALASGAGAITDNVNEVWFGKTLSTESSAGLTLDDLAISNQDALIGPSIAINNPITSSFLSVGGWVPSRRTLITDFTPPPQTPATVRQSHSVTSQSNTVSPLLMPQKAAIGNLLVAAVGTDKNTDAPHSTFVPTGWHLAGGVDNPSNTTMIVSWKIADGTETTVPWNASYSSASQNHAKMFAEVAGSDATGLVSWQSSAPTTDAPSQSATGAGVALAFLSTDTVIETHSSYAQAWDSPFTLVTRQIGGTSVLGSVGAAIAFGGKVLQSATAKPQGVPMDGHAIAVGIWGDAVAPEPPDPTPGDSLDTGLPRKVFSPDSFWYKQLPADAPLDPQSAQKTAFLKQEGIKNWGNAANGFPSWALNHYNNTPSVIVVNNSTPVANGGAGMTLRETAGGPYFDNLRTMFSGVRLPADLSATSGGTDRFLNVYNTDTDEYWDFWIVEKDAAGFPGWSAKRGQRIQNASTKMGVAEPYGSAPPYFYYGSNAAGLAQLGGAIMLQELEEGNIPHALSFAIPLVCVAARDVPTANAGISAPAVRSDGQSSAQYALKMGQRLRLPASMDLDTPNYHPVTRAVAKAFQKYGCFVVDRAGDISFAGENESDLVNGPARWNAVFQGAQAHNVMWDAGGHTPFPWDSLQVVQSDYLVSGSVPVDPEPETVDFTGKPMITVGDSYAAADYHNSPGQRAIQILHRKLGTSSNTLRAVSGETVGDQSARLISHLNPWTPGSADLAVIYVGLNDMKDPDTTQKRAAMLNHYRSLLTILMHGQHISCTSFSYDTAWTPNTNIEASRLGVNRERRWIHTGSSVASVNIVTPGDYYLGTIGLREPGLIGGVFTVAQGGQTIATVDTRNQHFQAVSGAPLGGKPYGPMTARLPNLQAGQLTVSWSGEGRTGEVRGYFDGIYRIDQNAAPRILLSKLVPVTAPSINRPTLMAYVNNTIIPTLAAEFGPRVVVADPNPGWNTSTHLGADGVHPNDAGNMHIANAWETAIRGATW